MTLMAKIKKRLKRAFRKKRQSNVLVFAYGSNLSSQRLGDRIFNFEKKGNYKLLHHRLVFNAGREQAYANVESEFNEHVNGVIYEISYRDMMRLDRYEGVPMLYDREEFKDEKWGTIYFYKAKPWYKTNTLPTLSYLRHVELGMMEHGIPFPQGYKHLERKVIENEQTINKNTNNRRNSSVL